MVSREMTPEERAQMESATLEVHAEFERRLRTYRPTAPKEYTHWLIGYNEAGEAVAFALDTSDADTAETALRWVREGRSVKLVTVEEGRKLFNIATKR